MMNPLITLLLAAIGIAGITIYLFGQNIPGKRKKEAVEKKERCPYIDGKLDDDFYHLKEGFPFKIRGDLRMIDGEFIDYPQEKIDRLKGKLIRTYFGIKRIQKIKRESVKGYKSDSYLINDDLILFNFEKIEIFDEENILNNPIDFINEYIASPYFDIFLTEEEIAKIEEMNREEWKKDYLDIEVMKILRNIKAQGEHFFYSLSRENFTYPDIILDEFEKHGYQVNRKRSCIFNKGLKIKGDQ